MRCCDCKYRSICTSASNDITAFCHCETRAVFKKSKIEDVINENAELRAKLEGVEKERDAAMDVLERLCEEVENMYGRETVLTEQARDILCGKERE